MAKQFCTECGAALEEGSRFCSECGTKAAPPEVKHAPENPSAQPQAQTQAQPQTQTQFSPGANNQPYVYAAQPQNGSSGAGPKSGGNQPPNGYSDNRGFQTAPVMSVGSYLLTYFILSIPIVGLIMFIIWAFDNSNPNRRNMIVAQFIWMLICTGLAIILLILFASSLAAFFSNYSIAQEISQYYSY